MVWPAIAAGIGGTLLGTIFGSETKKESSVYHAPYETYAPTTSRTYNVQYPDYNVVMNSPFSSAGSKKEQSAATTQTPTVSPVGGSVPGTNWALIAGIAAAGLVGYGLISGRKK